MSEVQERVRRVVERLVGAGDERGVQVAVLRHGEPWVEVTAGVADPVTGREVAPGTVFHNFSIGKSAASAVVHVCVERGAFGYDTRVADLWPEFAAYGKGAVTVRQVLTHTAGVPGLPADTTAADLCDWDEICATVADLRPWWEPGTAVGYHAHTFGYIVGEVVRRATGRPVSRVLAEEVTEPLGVAGELYFGIPVAEHGRLAVLEDAPGMGEVPAGLPANSPVRRASPPALHPSAALGNRADILAADIPACGTTSARAMARLFAALMGDVPGVELIAPERRAALTTVAAEGTDRVFGNESAWTLGFSPLLPGAEGVRPGAFGMGGAGGAFAFGDTATGVAFALTKNRLTPGFGAATEILGIVNEAAARKG
ncbi:serine hydrolase domain-containing protein [Streptomyces sp. SBT349]|uniref:serine hydrolase domain-containing protein n=1 Tax=Streptomyces sp. SBT349 TaxID=1580539 RepID=UPI00066D2D3F|nr:serine hydrolase domain-containing protein [Streptomyces sp. SBT349]